MTYVLGAVIATIGLVVIWYVWHRAISWRKRLRKETREAQGSLHNAFDALHEDFSQEIESLKNVKGKRELEREGDKAINHIEESLDIAEKFVRKEIEDVEKEVE